MGRNVIKLTLFLTALTVLFVLVGRAVGGTGGMFVAVVFALLVNGGAFWFSDRLVPGELPWLHDTVAQLARRAGLPLPAV